MPRAGTSHPEPHQRFSSNEKRRHSAWITGSFATETGSTSPTIRTGPTRLLLQAPAVAPPVICRAPAVPPNAPAGVPIAANTQDIGEQSDYVFRPELFAT